MPVIAYQSPQEAEGNVRELLEKSFARNGKPSLLLAVLAHSPGAITAWSRFYNEVMFDGEVDEDLKQLAHVAVSLANDCDYCSASHLEQLVETYGVEEAAIAGIVEDELDAFSRRQRVVLEFATSVATDPKRVGREDVDSLYDVGFTTGEVVELLLTVALANAANTVTKSMNVFPVDREGLVDQYSG